MTVAELLEQLHSAPTPTAIVRVRYVMRDGKGGLDWIDFTIADIHEDHGDVILETEVAGDAADSPLPTSNLQAPPASAGDDTKG